MDCSSRWVRAFEIGVIRLFVRYLVCRSWERPVDASSDKPGGWSIDVSDSYGDAENILKHSNQQGVRNEIIVVRSPKLQEIKGKVLYTDLEIEWLGVDLVVLGCRSLLENGLFPSPSYYTRWMRNLNKNGLLIESTDFEGFFQDYLVAAAKCSLARREIVERWTRKISATSA